MPKKIAVIRGDGIGPELTEWLVKILGECNLQSEIILCEAGSEQWEKNQKKDETYIPHKTMDTLKSVDACFKAPTTTLPIKEAPRSVAVTLRQKFELYANIRPCETYEKISNTEKLDFVCFREATEGLYTGMEVELTEDSAIAIRKITKKGSNRIIRSAAKWAKENNMKEMVVITKRNILKKTDGIFWREAENVTKEFELNLREIYIDNMAQQMVINPKQFDKTVLVSTNLFMDIISELASGLIGSIGLIYSANIGDSFAMFEAAHGSAPQIVGQNKANPTATILSGAWMAQYVGEKDIRDAIFEATRKVINDGKIITEDIGGNATTSQMSTAIMEQSVKNLRR